MFALKEILQECKSKNLKIGDYCQGYLIEKGYVKNKCFGWEKLEVLKRFNLDPNMKGVPAHQIEEIDKGKPTGKKIWIANQNWMNYITYKKQQEKDEYIAEQIIDEIKVEDISF